MVPEIIAATALVPASLVAGYYAAHTAVGGWRRTRTPPSATRRHMFAVLIPAHDEERLLSRCLRSIPRTDRVSVVVVADNCTDRTASVAEAAGVTVVVRNDP